MMTTMMIRYALVGIAFVVSLACGMAVTPMVVDYCKRRKLFDKPDARKVHHTPVPRLGGVCFLPCMGVAFAMAALSLYLLSNRQVHVSLMSIGLIVGAMIVYAVGLLDDLIEVRATRKMMVQIVSACCLPLSGLYFTNLYGLLGIWEIPWYVGVPLTVLFVVAVDNAMNLIDGIDGLCAGISLIGLAGFAVMFAHIGVWTYTVALAGLAGVLVAYSYFNLLSKRRKIFMGDSGSLTLGYILATCVVKLAQWLPGGSVFDEHQMVFAMSFLTVPCLDVLRVMFTRKRMGKGLFEPDRSHLHHRLIDAGYTQHQALGLILLLDLDLVALNVVMAWKDVPPTLILVVDMLVFALFCYGVHRRHVTRMKREAEGR